MIKNYSEELEQWKKIFIQKFLQEAKYLLYKDWVFLASRDVIINLEKKPKDISAKAVIVIRLC